MKKQTLVPPINGVVINRLLVVIVVLLALLAGYFHARYTNEEKLYNRLLNKYVDLQDQLDAAQALNE